MRRESERKALEDEMGRCGKIVAGVKSWRRENEVLLQGMDRGKGLRQPASKIDLEIGGLENETRERWPKRPPDFPPPPLYPPHS